MKTLFLVRNIKDQTDYLSVLVARDQFEFFILDDTSSKKEIADYSVLLKLVRLIITYQMTKKNFSFFFFYRITQSQQSVLSNLKPF